MIIPNWGWCIVLALIENNKKNYFMDMALNEQ